MELISRYYQGEEDYWGVRPFLRRVSLLNDRHDYSWSLLRWDYWRWHVNENIFRLDLTQAVRLWEAGGEIVAVVNPDSPGEAFLQIHPKVHSEGLILEMLEFAEETLPKTGDDGQKELIAWVNSDDALAKGCFTRRGFEPSQFLKEYMRSRPAALPVSSIQVPVGYTVRALGDDDELPARSWLSWKAFHPDEPDEAYQGWEWYKNVQRVPLYRRDLDIVAVAADGELAAFCTVWFDDVTRTAVFEPVGTHPDHQKRGLGKAVMAEGLRRAYRLGATLATVSSYGKAAHALYESMGFTDYDLLEPWIKEWRNT